MRSLATALPVRGAVTLGDRFGWRLAHLRAAASVALLVQAVLAGAVAPVQAAAIGPAKSGAPPLRGDAHSSQDAGRRAEIILNRVHIPGAVVGPPSTGSTRKQAAFPLPVVRNRTFSVVTSPDAVIAWLRAHPPQGFSPRGGASHVPAAGKMPAATIQTFGPSDRPHSGMQELSIIATDDGPGHDQVYVTVTVGWIAPRTPAETVHLIHGQPGFVVLAQPLSHSERGQRLTAAQSAPLGQALNALSTTSTSLHESCPPGGDSYVGLLAVHNHHHARYVIDLLGCALVSVTVDGRPQPLLAGTAHLADVLAALHVVPTVP